jgi:16S rRNA (adenine1518-N6/adenine1519-N6)-dimethyltransferase
MTKYNVKPKQSLGQNFLIDQNIAQKIVDCFAPTLKDRVLEIGPGYGILTRLLKAGHLTAVEIDQRLAQHIRSEFESCPNFELIQNDFLKIDLSEFKSVRIIGNIPYNITSPILFKVIEERKFVQDLTLLVQKEVADRIVASPNCKAYGILSVVSQTYADVKKLLVVPPVVFRPKPKIDSALVQWKFTNKRAQHIQDHDFFRKVVRQGFGQRRKMLRKSLRDLFENASTQIDKTRRPEHLSVDEWIQLSNELSL